MPKTAKKQNPIEQAVFNAFELSLDAQLKALRRLRAGPQEEKPAKKSMSQIDMVYDILERAAEPLHINLILERVEKIHRRRLDRESIVSALGKRVSRNDRFVRTGKNIFALKGGQGCCWNPFTPSWKKAGSGCFGKSAPATGP